MQAKPRSPGLLLPKRKNAASGTSRFADVCDIPATMRVIGMMSKRQPATCAGASRSCFMTILLSAPR